MVNSNWCYLYISITALFLAHPDCGLSVRWEPPKDTGACREFSPAGVKETWTDPGTEVLQGLVSRMQLSENDLKVGVELILSPNLRPVLGQKNALLLKNILIRN